MKLRRIQRDLNPERRAVRQAIEGLSAINLKTLRGEQIQVSKHERELDALYDACADHLGTLIFPWHAEVLIGDPHALTERSGSLHGYRVQWEAPRPVGEWCADDLALYQPALRSLRPFGKLAGHNTPKLSVKVEPDPESTPDQRALWKRTFGQSSVNVTDAWNATLRLLPETLNFSASDELRLAIAVHELLREEPIKGVNASSLLRAACAWKPEGFSAGALLFMDDQPPSPAGITSSQMPCLEVWSAIGGAPLLKVMTENLGLRRSSQTQPVSTTGIHELMGLTLAKGESSAQADVIKCALKSMNNIRRTSTHLIKEGSAQAPLWQTTQTQKIRDERSRLTLLLQDQVSVAGHCLTLAHHLAQGFIEPLMPRAQALSEASAKELETYSELAWCFGTLLAPLQERSTLKGARSKTVSDMLSNWRELRITMLPIIYLSACGPGWKTPLSDGQRELLTFDLTDDEVIVLSNHELVGKGEFYQIHSELASSGRTEASSRESARQLKWLLSRPDLGDTDARTQACLNLLFKREGWSLSWTEKETFKPVLKNGNLQLSLQSPPERGDWKQEVQMIQMLAQAAVAATFHARLKKYPSLMANREPYHYSNWWENGAPARLGAFVQPDPRVICGETIIRCMQGDPNLPAEMIQLVAQLSLTSMHQRDSASIYTSENKLILNMSETLTKHNMKRPGGPVLCGALQEPWLGMSAAAD